MMGISTPAASRLGAVLLGVVCALAFAASSAHAVLYCSGNIAGGGHCDGPYSALVQSLAGGTGTNAVCAGAIDSTGSFYGQYWCASSYACHTYAGSVTLAPRMHNHETFTQGMSGYYYTTSADPSCPRGGPLSLAASAGTRARVRARVASGQSPGQRCLQVPDGGGYGITCAPAATVDAGELVGTLEPGDGASGTTRTLYAAVPSAVTSVTVVSSSGARRAVTPAAGVLKATIPRDGTSSIVWHKAGGAPADTVPVPGS
jgi:hypothetical protein